MNKPDRTTIVIADDHPLVLRGVEGFIRLRPEFEVVATCANAESALAAIHQHVPTIALLDVALPDRSGIDILATVRAEASASRVVLLAASMRDSEIYDAVKLSVDGIVLKDSSPDVLLECLTRVARGEHWYPYELIQKAMERERERRAEANALISQLTAREREVACLAASGMSNKAIANHISIVEGTVKLHIHSIYRKLNILRRSDLVWIVSRFDDFLLGVDRDETPK